MRLDDSKPAQRHPSRILRPGLLLILALLATHCGPNAESPSRQTPEILPERVSIDPPSTAYFIADSACQTAKEPVPLTQPKAYLLTNLGLRSSQMVEANFRTEASFQTGAISQTIHGRIYERSCNYQDVFGRRCQDSDGIAINYLYDQSLTRKLRVCSDNLDYDRNSLEGIALSSALSIEKIHRNTIRATNGRIKPQSITLEIMPTYRSLMQNVPSVKAADQKMELQTFVTNNLAYSRTSRMITVFPETDQAYQQTLRGEVSAHLWESPFVLAHEYGHHIEGTLHSTVEKELALHWSPLTHQYEHNLSLVGTSNGELNYIKVMMTAVSEGFADLVGYFSEQGESTSISQLPSLALDRDPSRFAFADDQLKILDDQLISLLRQDIQVQDYSPHRIGAIFAHTIASCFAEMPALNWDRRLDLLIVWLQEFLKSVDSSKELNSDDLNQLIARSLGKALNMAIRESPASEQESIRREVKTVLESRLSGFPQQEFSL
jgi:hypothetical protein